jgi:NADPH2:quinone reductase
MKAIKITNYGDASVLQLTDREPKPAPAKGQVLVKIHAAGVNFVDIYQRRGTYPLQLPYIPGLEASGVVEALGPGAKGFRVGDRVAYTGHLGSYSEYTAIDAGRLIKLPKGLSFEQGAAFPLQGMTTHYLLHDFRKPNKGTRSWSTPLQAGSASCWCNGLSISALGSSERSRPRRKRWWPKRLAPNT